MAMTPPRLPRPFTPKRAAPTLTETITALTDYGTTPEVGDLREAVQWITKTHVGATHELPDGTFGDCAECHKPWPCPAWEEIRMLTLEWLIRASTTAVHKSRGVA